MKLMPSSRAETPAAHAVARTAFQPLNREGDALMSEKHPPTHADSSEPDQEGDHGEVGSDRQERSDERVMSESRTCGVSAHRPSPEFGTRARRFVRGRTIGAWWPST